MSNNSEGWQKRILTVPVADLDATAFTVRTQLDQERVLFLQNLIRAKHKFDPLEVVWDETKKRWVIVAGHNRYMAYVNEDIEMCEVVIVPETEYIKLKARGMQTNWGGPQPHTYADVYYNVSELIRKGYSGNQIRNHFLFIDRRMLNKAIEEVNANIQKQRVTDAARKFVAEGGRVSIEKVAEDFGVSEEAVRVKLGQQVSDTHGSAMWGTIKADVTKKNHSAATLVTAIFKSINECYDKGDLSIEQVQDLIRALHNGVEKNLRCIKDNEARFVNRVKLETGNDVPAPKKRGRKPNSGK